MSKRTSASPKSDSHDLKPASPAATQWRKLSVGCFDQLRAEALRELQGLDREAHRRSARYLVTHSAGDADPRRFDQRLPAALRGGRCDRVGDDRAIARLLDERTFVRIVRVDDRKDAYDF
jgi:mRNA-degrading endonuclease RelE of RelBE toxin-antitoxin system